MSTVRFSFVGKSYQDNAAEVVDGVLAHYLEGRMGAAMKLQKLVYYAQAWSLVWDEAPLFHARIEAWSNGPVAPALYREHRADQRGVRLVHADDPVARVHRRHRVLHRRRVAPRACCAVGCAGRCSARTRTAAGTGPCSSRHHAALDHRRHRLRREVRRRDVHLAADLAEVVDQVTGLRGALLVVRDDERIRRRVLSALERRLSCLIPKAI